MFRLSKAKLFKRKKVLLLKKLSLFYKKKFVEKLKLLLKSYLEKLIFEVEKKEIKGINL